MREIFIVRQEVSYEDQLLYPQKSMQKFEQGTQIKYAVNHKNVNYNLIDLLLLIINQEVCVCH